MKTHTHTNFGDSICYDPESKNSMTIKPLCQEGRLCGAGEANRAWAVGAPTADESCQHLTSVSSNAHSLASV